MLLILRMSLYTPRTYSTTKRMDTAGYEPTSRYSEIGKVEFNLPNAVDPESTPEKRRIFIAIVLTLAMT